MSENIFGQPENNQSEAVAKEGNNPTLIAILLILILGGGAGLGFLLYRQSQETAPVLDEVVETVELPTTTPTPEVINELPVVEDSTNIVDETSSETNSLDNETLLGAPIE
ncbi:MAG: hypothetical protein WD512_10835 [Candidatus Paceibacterota bacterium]